MKNKKNKKTKLSPEQASLYLGMFNMKLLVHNGEYFVIGGGNQYVKDNTEHPTPLKELTVNLIKQRCDAYINNMYEQGYDEGKDMLLDNMRDLGIEIDEKYHEDLGIG